MSREIRPYVIEYFAFGRSASGGPVRWVANGHRTHAVGLLSLNKSRYLATPWESRKVEFVIYRMLSSCSRVVDIVGQPHSLFIGIQGIKRQIRYTPDVEVLVHPSFRDELLAGVPLHQICSTPFVERSRYVEPILLVIELKADDDASLADPSYETKMKMVRMVYSEVGQNFLTLMASDHIHHSFSTLVTDLEIAAYDAVGPVERSRCSLVFAGRPVVPFGQLCDDLGGVPKGVRLVKALHFKDVISIDLRQGLIPSAPVWSRLDSVIFGHG